MGTRHYKKGAAEVEMGALLASHCNRSGNGSHSTAKVKMGVLLALAVQCSRIENGSSASATGKQKWKFYQCYSAGEVEMGALLHYSAAELEMGALLALQRSRIGNGSSASATEVEM